MENRKVVDGNYVASYISYAFSDVFFTYPITPATPMADYTDLMKTKKVKNIYGSVPKYEVMQSEAGVAGAVHGALSAGSIATTFTASQGLLLMIPSIYKMVGECLPGVIHVASRSLAMHSLSIFGDHSDVMAVRQTGVCMLCSSNIEEVQDFSIISHLASLKSSLPFIHFFDGFQTSHDISNIDLINYDELKDLVDNESIMNLKKRALNSNHPIAKVAAQNPDVYFQNRERSNVLYENLKDVMEEYFEIMHKKFGRRYDFFNYYGDYDSSEVIVCMGSSFDTVKETVDYLNLHGCKYGVVKVNVYRPFLVDDFLKVLPRSVKRIAVLDKTKESGSVGEPLFLDVAASLKQSEEFNNVKVIGGRYGLSSKEFTPSMVKGVFDYLIEDGEHDFTVGINDDLTKKSIFYDEDFDIDESKFKARIYGLGSDGSVGMTKATAKLLGEKTDLNVEEFSEYDSRKSGAVTINHLRIDENRLTRSYFVKHPDLVMITQSSYLRKYDLLDDIKEGGILVVNTILSKEDFFKNQTKDVQDIIKEKKLNVFLINANKIARENNLIGKISTVMQVSLFKALSDMDKEFIEFETVINLIKDSIKARFAHKPPVVVESNLNCIRESIESLSYLEKRNYDDSSSKEKITILDFNTFTSINDGTIDHGTKEFVEKVMQPTLELKGNKIPVSRLSVDGHIPIGTAQYESSELNPVIPKWVSDKCIQCGFCSFICPQGAIKIKQINPDELVNTPEGFDVVKAKTRNDKDLKYRVQIDPKKCTSCNLCVDACPTKPKSLVMTDYVKEEIKLEKERSVFFDNLSEDVKDGVPKQLIKNVELGNTYFDNPIVCSGCGESTYVKLLTQLYGDRLIIANATGCSSIWGGSFPLVPYKKDKNGQGPAWANSLFEDNAEYALGIRESVDISRDKLKGLIEEFVTIHIEKKQDYVELNDLLYEHLNEFDSLDEESKYRGRKLRQLLVDLYPTFKDKVDDVSVLLKNIHLHKDHFIDSSVWAVGGDGWAYDIGFSGIDHLLLSKKNVNVLVLDTEMYSNTGGQVSKSSPIGSILSLSHEGKETKRKDLAKIAMTYENAYVATVNISDFMQVLRAFKEAEEFDGPSIIIAYCNCIDQGANMNYGLEFSKLATESFYFPLFRYNPALIKEGKNPFKLDSKKFDDSNFDSFMSRQNRYRLIDKLDEDRRDKLKGDIKSGLKRNYEYYSTK